MKRFLSALVLAYMLGSLCLAGCAGRAGGAEKRIENSISYFYTGADTSTRFICNNTLLEDRLGGEADAFLTCDGTVGAARVGTGLYRIDESGVLMIHPAGVDRALISLDGSKIVYTTATEVHIYDHATGSLEDIKPEGVSSVLSIALSPDGNTVGFSVRASDKSIAAYSHANGETVKLADNAYLVGIGDGAAFWYSLTPEAELIYGTKKGEKKLASEVSDALDFNRDLTQAVFDSDGETMISANGGAAKPLVGGASLLTTAGACFSTQGGEACRARVRDCDSLLGCVYYNYSSDNNEDNPRILYNLWYLTPARRAIELAKGAYQFSISEDRSTLTCLVDETVYRMDIDSPGSAKVMVENVYTYLAARDAKSFYCIGYDRKLYYVAAGASPVELLDGAVYCVMTDAGKCLAIADYDTTGTLYLADGLNPVVKVADKICKVETSPGSCRCYSAAYEDEAGNNVYDLYTSKDGLSFELMLKGVKLYTN